MYGLPKQCDSTMISAQTRVDNVLESKTCKMVCREKKRAILSHRNLANLIARALRTRVAMN